MLKLESLLAFVATAEAGSISEAARRLQISKSVASERLAELERNVGATLVHRSVPVSFGILHLSPALNSFLKRNPRIELSLDLNDRFVGATDGFDAIIRHGPSPNKEWLAKRIAPSRRVLVASPDYLTTNGMPRTSGDLERHRGIIYSHRGASDWRLRHSGRWSAVRPRASTTESSCATRL